MNLVNLRQEFLNTLFQRIKHGDDDHQKWLLEECDRLAPLVDEMINKAIDLCSELAVHEFYGSKRNMSERQTGWRIYEEIIKLKERK